MVGTQRGCDAKRASRQRQRDDSKKQPAASFAVVLVIVRHDQVQVLSFQFSVLSLQLSVLTAFSLRIVGESSGLLLIFAENSEN